MTPHADTPEAAFTDTSFDDTSFGDTSFDELRAEAVLRFEALVDRVTDGLMNDPVDNGPAHDREACRLAAIALLAEANRTAFGADSAITQVLRSASLR
ncbi:hypothetical protein [Rhizobacter sp. P5_C2]